MTNLEEINKMLQDHESRLQKLEASKQAIRSDNQTAKPALADHIIRLRDENFFNQPKTGEEVHAKIQETYPCERNRVEVALLRLAAKKELRRATKNIGDKSYKAYVW